MDVCSSDRAVYSAPISARSPRVLEVFQPPDGGVAEHVRLLAAGLQERDHPVAVAGPAGAAPREAIEALGVEYRPVELTGRVPDPLADWRAGRELRRLVADGRFDLVHAHGQKAGVLGRRAAARGGGLPALYTPHSFVYRTQAMRPRRSAKLRFELGRRLERRLARGTAFVVAVAEDERRTAIADGIAPAERIVVVYPGVAPPGPGTVPDPRLREFRGEGPLLGFVAGLRDQKGLPVLLDALEALAARGRSPRFAIVGNGPLWAEVAGRVARPALRDSTLLVPFESGAYAYLEALDGFVLPSLWEGLPMAVLEAMSAGLPVVASAVNGTPEAVEDGVTGYLVPPGDAEALADRLAALAADADARRRMGENARAVAAERFGADQMVERLIQLYRSAAGTPDPGRGDGNG